MKRIGITTKNNLCLSTCYRVAHQQRFFARLKTHQNEYRSILEEYMKNNNISHVDFYRIAPHQISDENVSHVINRKFRGSMYKALSSIFPEIEWIPWKFEFCNVPNGYWKDMSNQRKFFDILGKKIGVTTLDDWYDKYSVEVLVENGGLSLLKQYKNSAMLALLASYPEHNWIPWKFKVTLHGYWKSIDNQRKYFDWLGKEIGIQKMEDWYAVSIRTLEAHKGTGLIKVYYNGSIREALQTVYPQYNWIPWKFESVSKDFWKSSENVSKFLQDLSDKLSIQNLDDWYRVDWVQINKLGGSTMLKTQKGLYPILKQHYPHHDWDPKKFLGRKKAQRWLAVTLEKIFPGEEIKEDYMHPKAISSFTRRPLQLDVFLPSKSLAFEYQGEQHFQEVGIYSPLRTYEERDAEKRTLCAQNNIKLIEVPFWWNRSQEDLQELIETGKLPDHRKKEDNSPEL